jgi:hypothetical protein
MPVHVNDIITHTKPLDEKIFEFLSANPDQFYTDQELQTALGEFDGFTVLGSKEGPEWMFLGFLADVAFADDVGKVRTENAKRYAMALTALMGANRIQGVNYGGTLRFGVTKALPGWVDQPVLLPSQ